MLLHRHTHTHALTNTYLHARTRTRGLTRRLTRRLTFRLTRRLRSSRLVLSSPCPSLLFRDSIYKHEHELRCWEQADGSTAHSDVVHRQQVACV